MATASHVARSQPDAPLVERILATIAAAEQCDVLDLPPIYDTVDADVLERVVDGGGFVEVSFRYHGHRVTVDGDGAVDLSSP